MSSDELTVDYQLRAAAADSADRPSVLHDGDVWTFADLDHATARAANAIDALGVDRGEHVALLMGNRPEFLFAWLGAARIGRPVIGVNAGLKGDGLAFVIDNSDAVVVVVEDELLDALSEILPGLPKVRQVIVVGDRVEHGHLSWTDLVDAAAPEVEDVDVRAHEPMMVMYTSGTTGRPKGVVVAQSRCFGPSLLLQAAGIGREDVGYTCLPFFHAAGALVAFWGSHGLRAPLAIGRRFSASRHWDDLRRYGATWFNALGSIIPILMKQEPKPDDADNPCRTVISAGCPKDLWKAFEDRWGVGLFEWYGTIEGGTTIAGPGAPIGSIGKPLPGTDAKVIRLDGTEADSDEVGELLFKPQGHNATVAYYKNDAASAEKTYDGWLHTGDRVYADAEGFLWYVDRGAHFIRRSGENIAAAEVETIVNAHPDVLESAAYGLPSPLGEEDVAVAVVRQPRSDLTAPQLIDFCVERMAKFQVPRYVRLVERLPKTATEKTQNLTLREDGVTPDTFDRDAAP